MSEATTNVRITIYVPPQLDERIRRDADAKGQSLTCGCSERLRRRCVRSTLR